MITPFSIAALPKIVFGHGCLAKLGALLEPYGSRVLVLTGKTSFRESKQYLNLERALSGDGFSLQGVVIESEPSPGDVDVLVNHWRSFAPQMVLAIGGGSVMDAGKAMAGLIPQQHSVMDYLEGVGPELPYEGPSLPLIAVPTTAGTGSEATKNAVLSVSGPNGFKKSFRSEKLVAALALLDPDLLASAPAPLIAANGMDALTQLMESYVSSGANPFTDALALSGIQLVIRALPVWYRQQAHAKGAMGEMAYAALLSGICLAQAGLGSVHGLASPLGAFFPIPHGVVCGTLLAEATALNLQAMQEREPENSALAKYRHMAKLFHQGGDTTKMLAVLR